MLQGRVRIPLAPFAKGGQGICATQFEPDIRLINYVNPSTVCAQHEPKYWSLPLHTRAKILSLPYHATDHIKARHQQCVIPFQNIVNGIFHFRLRKNNS